MLFRTEKTSS
jgi:serine/threonine protein kinase